MKNMFIFSCYNYSFLSLIVFYFILIQPHHIHAQSSSKAQTNRQERELFRMLEDRGDRPATFDILPTVPGTGDGTVKYHSSGKPYLRIVNLTNNKIEYLSPIDPRYQEAERRLQKIERRLGRIRITGGSNSPAPRLRLREDGTPDLDDNRGGTLRRLGWVGRLVTIGGVFLAVVKDGKVEANEASNAVADSIGEALGEVSLDAGDLSVEKYLDNLKLSAEHISRGNYPLFSAHRQSLTAQLNEVHNEISRDTSLEPQQKRRLLARVNEIKNTVQPSSPPRNPPRRRSRRSRGGVR